MTGLSGQATYRKSRSKPSLEHRQPTSPPTISAEEIDRALKREALRAQVGVWANSQFWKKGLPSGWFSMCSSTLKISIVFDADGFFSNRPLRVSYPYSHRVNIHIFETARPADRRRECRPPDSARRDTSLWPGYLLGKFALSSQQGGYGECLARSVGLVRDVSQATLMSVSGRSACFTLPTCLVFLHINSSDTSISPQNKAY